MNLQDLRNKKSVIRAAKWNKDNKERRKEITMNSQWKSIGMTIGGSVFTYDDYNRFFVEQNGCCDICGKHQVDLNKALSADHNHNTNEVRGLLCQRCNTVLGMCLDDKSILESAIKYLEKNK
jgi:hypothetical protein